MTGEHAYGNSGVVFNDEAKRATRYAGRGGMGSVLASKRVKFIITNRKNAPDVELADKSLFNEGRKKMTEALQTHDITKPKGGLNTYGTAVLINIMNEAGGLPTRNFSSGRFEGAADIAGEAIFDGNKKRLGKDLYNHACSPGCIVQCSNTWFNEDGKEIASCIEYESDWALGADCGIDSLDDIAEMVRLCNEYGLDTIETGTTLAVAMEAGVVPFGDGKGAINLIHEMGKGTPLGRILGGGTGAVGKAYGLTRVPVVKNQGIPAYDPRSVKGIGITYATSTMGADHTAGYTIATNILNVGGYVDPLKKDGQVELSRNLQIATAAVDSTGMCIFVAFPALDIPECLPALIDMINARYGLSLTGDDVVNLGKYILKTEHEFNIKAGFTNAADRLPEFFTYEPVAPHNALWDFSDAEIDEFWNF